MGRPNAFNGMMAEFVGRGWGGFCVKDDGETLFVTDLIPEAGRVSADEFAYWMILADGVDPDKAGANEIRRWMSQLKEVFVRHMGAEVVDASKLRSGYNE